MTAAYDRIDLGAPYSDPGIPFKDQIIYMVKNDRDAIPGTVKAIVTYDYHDGDLGYSYKHYVPYGNIFNQLNEMIVGNMTRAQIVKHIVTLTEKLYGSYSFGEGNPLSCRAAFDAWLNEGITAICDWPLNIFQAKSEGDGNGTILDKPLPPYGDGLLARLNKAYLCYKELGLTNL